VKKSGRKDDREQWQNRSTTLPSLRELRQSRGLSQRELGKLAKVSAGTVYRLENQQRGAYPVTVKKLASALRISPAELVRENHPR
jgi:transcriptional regulator with XRE-family HTH domain